MFLAPVSSCSYCEWVHSTWKYFSTEVGVHVDPIIRLLLQEWPSDCWVELETQTLNLAESSDCFELMFRSCWFKIKHLKVSHRCFSTKITLVLMPELNWRIWKLLSGCRETGVIMLKIKLYEMSEIKNEMYANFVLKLVDLVWQNSLNINTLH